MITEEEYLELAETGQFDEIAFRIRQTPGLTQAELYDLLYDLEMSKQEMEYDKTREENYKKTKYSNLQTTTTNAIIGDVETIITDKNNNQIGVAIDGNEKQLLDLYAAKVYDSLQKPLLDEKFSLLQLSKDFKLIFDGVRYKGAINGRTIEFYAIGNNNEIRAYAFTLTSPDSQNIRIIFNTANDIRLYFQGLKETFPTT